MPHYLTLTLLTWRIWWTPTNASKWQMGFNSAFKGLNAFFFWKYVSINVVSKLHKDCRSVTLIPLWLKCLWVTYRVPAFSVRVLQVCTSIGWINGLTELKLWLYDPCVPKGNSAVKLINTFHYQRSTNFVLCYVL